MGTKKVNTSGYHLQMDGLVNSTLINMLSKVVRNMLVIGTDIYLIFSSLIEVHCRLQPKNLHYGLDPRQLLV